MPKSVAGMGVAGGAADASDDAEFPLVTLAPTTVSTKNRSMLGFILMEPRLLMVLVIDASARVISGAARDLHVHDHTKEEHYFIIVRRRGGIENYAR
jgi:hypothetical protein